jgi:hypothetical protein
LALRAHARARDAPNVHVHRDVGLRVYPYRSIVFSVKLNYFAAFIAVTDLVLSATTAGA